MNEQQQTVGKLNTRIYFDPVRAQFTSLIEWNSSNEFLKLSFSLNQQLPTTSKFRKLIP